jgi:type IV pilus assembly protein PilB
MGSNKILQKLLEDKRITSEQATNLKVNSSKTGKSIETLLVESNILSDVDLVKLKADIFGIPFIDLNEVKVDDKNLNLLPFDTMKRYKLLVFETEGMLVKLAMADPFDVQALNYVKNKLKKFKRFDTYIAARDQVLNVLDKHSTSMVGQEIEESLEDVEFEEMEIKDPKGDIDTNEANLANAPVAKIVNTIIQHGAKMQASDIHIEPLEARTRVRYRVDGMLMEKISLPIKVHSSLVARIKIMSELKIDVKKAPQDGRIPIKYKNQRFDLRVSTLPSVYGEKVVMRLLERGTKIPSLAKNGLRGPAYNSYIEATNSNVGIILVTGPTGSGKTRTLASTLRRIKDETVNIVTLEDPVEIRTPGITQVQVNPQVGLTFASGLRSILRQDPDIIMVGEIRDQETADLAVRAALTGHLVLATLHTNSAAAALPRLVDMGLENYLLASTIQAVVAQRLVRTICPNCAKAVEVTPELKVDINETLGSIEGFDVENYLKAKCSQGNVPEFFKCPENGKAYIHKGKGCDECDGDGYAGRTGIFEVLTMNNHIGRLLMKNKATSEIHQESVKNGMLTMKQDGYLKALDGITTIEEVLRVSSI